MNGRASQLQWCDVEEVARAAADCEVRKRSRPDAIAFRARFGEEVLSLAHRLRTGEYRPEPGTVFVTERPKYREVHAAAYRDRVRLGLRFRRQGRRRLGAGVPFKLAGALIRRALDRGLSVALAFEGPGAFGNVRGRALRWWFEPLPYQYSKGQLLLSGITFGKRGGAS